jgi:hypothetical protein
MQKKPWLNIAIGMLAVLAIAGGVAFADNIQCKTGGCSDSVASNGSLVVKYDITGLGGTSEAGFVLTATLEGHARCKNQGGNCPEAANKFGPADTFTQGTLTVHNGRARGSVSLTADTDLDCPGNQDPVIIDVTWTNIVFTVEGVEVFSDPGPKFAALVSCQ